MGNRIQFFQSVDQKDKEYDSVITSLFEQFSALYDIVGTFDNVQVINQTEKEVVFEVISTNKEDIDIILERVASRPNVVIYEQSFFIHAIKNTDLDIKLTFLSK